MIPIRGDTRVLAVIGHPIAHSLSPTMYNAAFAALGLDAIYVGIDVAPERLSNLLDGLAAGGIAGNITIPHKQAAARFIPNLTATADDVGAVNTFLPADGMLEGDNTDVGGVLDALEALDAAGPWLMSGTGGSARAVAAAAHAAGATLLVQSRDRQRSMDFAAWARGLGTDAHTDDGREIGTAINATSLGLQASDPPPFGTERLVGCSAVLDLVYAPGGTELVRQCQRHGMPAADGRGVLVGQGVRAFERFFPDTTAPRDVMERAVEDALAA